MMPNSGLMDSEEWSKTATGQYGEEEEEGAWIKCLGAQEDWIHFRRQVEYKSKEEEEVTQAVDICKDYLKMVDGRKKRQTEKKLCKLMWAWIVLKRRHERRQKWRNVTAPPPSLEAEERVEMIKVATTPTRKMKATLPKSPTNPIEETHRPSMETTAETEVQRQRQLKRECLKKEEKEHWKYGFTQAKSRSIKFTTNKY
jgi:hypothetical protein